MVKTRIVGCVIAYQEAPGGPDASLLKTCLQAIRPHVDRIVVVDGAYAEFPFYGPTAASADETLAVARRFADHVIEIPNGRAWVDEIEKRNAYLCREPGEYYLVVDADEIVEGVIDREALTSAPDWRVNLWREEDPHRLMQPLHRLFLARAGLRYYGAHHALHFGDALIHPDTLPVLAGLRLRHAQRRRPLERIERKSVYYKKLVPAEADFRKAHHL